MDEHERKKAAKEVRAKMIEKRNKKKSDVFLRVKKEIQITRARRTLN